MSFNRLNKTKMRKLKSSLTLATLLVIVISLSPGCTKDTKEEAIDNETGSALDHAFAQATYDDVGAIADQAALSGFLSTYKFGKGKSILLAQCATIAHDTSITPKQVIVDFGTSNCLCIDVRYRRGKIIIAYNGAYRDSGSSHIISFDDYFVNDYKVEGTKTVTNGGHNLNGNLFFNISVDGLITSPSGNTLDWDSNRLREWVQGEGTPSWMDDVYEISGSATGNSLSGIDFTAVITDPLVIALNCKWVKDGNLEFTPAGLETRYIDYGHVGGNCDKLAKVTIAGYDFIIELR